jgi:ATP-dependent protease ClpP protease subunit
MPTLVLNRKDVSTEHRLETVLNVEGSTIEIYDSIVPWKFDASDSQVTVKDVTNALDNATGDITLRINSRGGEVGTSLAIYNRLKDYSKGTKTAIVDGYAFSAAGWIPLACENRHIATGGIFMAHNPMMYPAINSLQTLEKVGEQWKAYHKSIVSIFVENTSMSEDEVIEMMDKETFLSAEDAIKKGLFTKLDTNKANLSALNYGTPANLPSNFKLPPAAPLPPMEPLLLQRRRLLSKFGK